MIPHPIIHHPFEFSLGPITLTGFGLAMMLAFGMAHWVSQEVLEERGDDPGAGYAWRVRRADAIASRRTAWARLGESAKTQTPPGLENLSGVSDLRHGRP